MSTPLPENAAGRDKLSPFKFLVEATKKYAPLKYAWGIGGILALLAIAKLFQISPTLAIVGTVLMLIGMCLLAVFATAVSNLRSGFTRFLSQLLLAACVFFFLLTAAFPFSVVWFNCPITRAQFFRWLSLPLDDSAKPTLPAITKDVGVIPKANVPPKLTLARIMFDTLNDDKDKDTRLDIYLKLLDNTVKGENANIHGRFPDWEKGHLLNLRAGGITADQDSYPYTLKKEEVPKCKLVIQIATVGKDIWRFKYVLTLTFDDGTAMSFPSGTLILSDESPKYEVNLGGFVGMVNSLQGQVTLKLLSLHFCSGEQREKVGDRSKLIRPPVYTEAKIIASNVILKKGGGKIFFPGAKSYLYDASVSYKELQWVHVQYEIFGSDGNLDAEHRHFHSSNVARVPEEHESQSGVIFKLDNFELSAELK
jgi:hypothetical protein